MLGKPTTWYGERVGLEHAAFRLLIFGTNGGMGAECSMFVKPRSSVRREVRSSVLQCAGSE